ncbi:hypothetical protein FALBO_16990 [Fusarium albosuccineum]|uniref:Uncharacterized protein n=1 Tax=Fusarium albosuccineum TaxID=1237068 RepID=A0A8H4KCY2_9HYPO|nr:hypothetical protein FALBO_16990 [Fusarium albosuccineum]
MAEALGFAGYGQSLYVFASASKPLDNKRKLKACSRGSHLVSFEKLRWKPSAGKQNGAMERAFARLSSSPAPSNHGPKDGKMKKKTNRNEKKRIVVRRSLAELKKPGAMRNYRYPPLTVSLSVIVVDVFSSLQWIGSLFSLAEIQDKPSLRAAKARLDAAFLVREDAFARPASKGQMPGFALDPCSLTLPSPLVDSGVDNVHLLEAFHESLVLTPGHTMIWPSPLFPVNTKMCNVGFSQTSLVNR